MKQSARLSEDNVTFLKMLKKQLNLNCRLKVETRGRNVFRFLEMNAFLRLLKSTQNPYCFFVGQIERQRLTPTGYDYQMSSISVFPNKDSHFRQSYNMHYVKSYQHNQLQPKKEVGIYNIDIFV